MKKKTGFFGKETFESFVERYFGRKKQESFMESYFWKIFVKVMLKDIFDEEKKAGKFSGKISCAQGAC